MLTLEDIYEIELGLSRDIDVRVAKTDTKVEGTLMAVIHVTPEKPDDNTLAILVLWDGDEKPTPIDIPAEDMELVT